MACHMVTNESWLPVGLQRRLVFDSECGGRTSVEDWLRCLRNTVEEYDPILERREFYDSALSLNSCESADEVGDAFDDILKDIGNEIYSLDVYQRRTLHNGETSELSHSILEIFDEFLAEDMERDEKETKRNIDGIFDKGLGTPVPPRRRNRFKQQEEAIYGNINVRQTAKPRPVSRVEYLTSKFNNKNDGSSTDSGNNSPKGDTYQTLWNCSSGKMISSSDSSLEFPPSYASLFGRLKKERPSSCVEPRESENAKLIHAHACKNATRLSPRHDSLSSSNNTASSSVYSCSDDAPTYANERLPTTIDNMTIDVNTAKRLTYDFIDNDNYDYECASITSDFKYVDNLYEKTSSVFCDDEENIYEEIRGDHYSDISLRTFNSVEVETCESVCTNGSFDCPIYENIKDSSAFILTSDVIAWKDRLLDPFYNDDEEDEWISQDEALLYSKETRPPFIIPRIKHYIPSRPVNFGNNRLRTSQDDLLFDHSPTDLPGEPLSPSIKEVRKMFEVRSQNDGYRHNMPVRNMDKGGIRLDFAIEKGFVKASSESPKFIRLPQRIGGSNEMLSHKRVNMTPIKSGSGENLVEVRGEHQSSLARNGKAKSMIGHATLGQWSPVSVQRVLPKLYDPNMHALLEGFVNRTRLTENGKKVRKNWVHNYLIMTQTSLAFYKDLKTYQITKSAMHAGTPPSPTSSSKPDLVLSLHGAVVSRCTSQHTSRYAHACIVTTAHRDQVIIQHDSPAVANHWYEEILKTINKLPSDYVCPNNNNLGGESPRDEHKSTPTSTRKNVQKGKSNNKDEPVFGRSLEQVSPESGLRVPDFVVRCVKAIESTEENMCTDGLYRASGNLSQVQKIRLEVDQNNMSVLDNEVDVHVLTGALKLFFRELKEPLIPCRLFHKALNASANQHRESRVKEFREIYFGIPDSNRQTLKYLLEHLLRVTSYKDKNRMHIPNIAIVFGPTLLWAPIESAHNMATDCLQQNQVIETLLTDYDLIFREDHIRRK